MDRKGLEVFLAIAMGQTLSRAAEVLNLSQSAVSRRLKQLESGLGLVLVDRQQGIKQARLTEEGERLLPIAIRWQELQREVRLVQSRTPALSLTLGSVDSVNIYVLPPLLLALQARQIRVRLHTLQPAELYRRIESRELDAAIVPIEPDARQAQAEVFMRDTMRLVRPEADAGSRTVVQASELDPTKETYLRWSAEYELWHNHVWGADIASLQLDSVALVCELLLSRGGWAVIPASAMPLLRGKGLAFQELLPTPPERIHFLITHRFPRASLSQPLAVLREVASELGFCPDTVRHVQHRQAAW